MPPADRAVDGYALALDEARRALDEQERAVAQVSARAGLLISAAAIVTSFLGGPVLARGNLDLAAWIATTAFVGLTTTVIAVLWPRLDWEFAMHPAMLIADYVERSTDAPLAPDRLRRELALNMGASVTRNRRALNRLLTTFNIGSVLLAIEILAWIVSIASAG